MDSPFELAQVNVARLLAPLDSPEIAEFVAPLEPINRLADHSPGFVWRLTTPDGDATAIRAFDDDMIIVNLTVWDSLKSLRAFAYASNHVGVLRRRREWFERLATAPGDVVDGGRSPPDGRRGPGSAGATPARWTHTAPSRSGRRSNPMERVRDRRPSTPSSAGRISRRSRP
jgi:hypothetical protein